MGRQEAILSQICLAYLRDEAITYRELAAQTKLSSPSTVSYHVDKLVQNGCLRLKPWCNGSIPIPTEEGLTRTIRLSRDVQSLVEKRIASYRSILYGTWQDKLGAMSTSNAG